MKLSELIHRDRRLDVDVEIGDGDIISDILVLARAVQINDATDALVLASSEGTTGITQYGIVCSAKLELEMLMTNGDDDE